MILSHWFAAGLFLASTPVAAQPQRLEAEVAPATPIDRTTITDEVAIGRDVADRMTVAVNVSGKGPYRFLIDTGSERTVISRQLAQRLNLDAGKDATLHSVVGANAVETVFIPTTASLGYISSSLVKEVASLGGDVSALVPPSVHARLLERLAQG